MHVLQIDIVTASSHLVVLVPVNFNVQCSMDVSQNFQDHHLVNILNYERFH